jgi:hypothetical protein
VLEQKLLSEMDTKKYHLMAAWQVLSSDLSLLDFFFWDCLMSRVCHSGKVQNRQQVTACIIN